MKKSIGAGTFVYPTPVWVIGTYDKEGKENVMTAAWAGVACSQPPAVSVSLRKATYTYQNIVDRKAFTVNLPSEKYLKEADYFGIVSGRDVAKLSVCGLTPVKSDLVDAPYVKEFPVVLECKLIHMAELGLHTQFVGEVVDVKVEDHIIGDNDKPDIEKIKPILYTIGQNNAYYGVGQQIGKAFSIGKEYK